MELTQPLLRLETAELIRRLSEEVSEGSDLAYHFKHALVQDTSYTSLLKNERKRLHRLIGETLESAYPEAIQENAALLLKHFIEAGDDEKILEYGVCAGDAEARIFAKTEAIEHYSAALDAAVRLEVAPLGLIDLVTKLGRMFELRGEHMRALQIYMRLNEMAEQRKDPALELAGLMLQATLRATPTSVFDPLVGQAILDRARELAVQLNDGAAEAKILWILLLLNGFSGHYPEAVAYGEQSLALARQLGLKIQEAYTLNDIGNYGYFASGQPDKSRAALTEARALWRELDILPMLDDNLNNSGVLEYVRGNFPLARELSDEALALSERIGNAWGEGLARAFRGLLSMEAGDLGTALRELGISYELSNVSKSGILIIAATNLAMAYSMSGEIDTGYQVIQVADDEIEIPLYRAPAKAALAYLTFLRGDVEHAEALLVNARPKNPDELQFSYLPSIIAEGEMGLAAGRAEYVAEYTAALVKGLADFGISNFIADAELYRGRALMTLGRGDAARAAFEHGYQYAVEIASVRVRCQITTYWAKLEREQNNVARAQELEEEAHALTDSIANSLPEKYQAKFREWAALRQE